MQITITRLAPSAEVTVVAPPPTYEELVAQVAFLLAHLQEADREIAELKAQAAEDTRVIAEYRQTIDGLLRENTALRTHDADDHLRIEQLQREAADLRGQVADLDALLRAARATIAATEQELLALQARHGLLTSGLRSLLEAAGPDNG